MSIGERLDIIECDLLYIKKWIKEHDELQNRIQVRK